MNQDLKNLLLTHIPANVLRDVCNYLADNEGLSTEVEQLARIDTADDDDIIGWYLGWNGIIGYTQRIMEALDGIRAFKAVGTAAVKALQAERASEANNPRVEFVPAHTLVAGDEVCVGRLQKKANTAHTAILVSVSVPRITTGAKAVVTLVTKDASVTVAANEMFFKVVR